ncbi:MAG: ferrous iron transport protein A [Candidatus Aminicenantes bacterium]|nr:ferrous iron transport protein A [Candidatus Aminicenantes bacterium]
MNLKTRMADFDEEMERMSKQMSLVELPPGAPGRLVSISGSPGVRRRLFSLGLHIGDRISIKAQGPFRGPFLLNNLSTDNCLAVGRGIAQRILVEVEDDS